MGLLICLLPTDLEVVRYMSDRILHLQNGKYDCGW